MSFRSKLLCLLFILSSVAIEARYIEEPPTVLSPRERVDVVNDVLRQRLDNLLPELMRESGLDMWLVIHREYSEDQLFFSLVPQPTFAARQVGYSFP